MTAAFEVSIKPGSAEISNLTETVMAFLQGGGVDSRTTHHVALALEEMLTNLATHGNAADSPATIRLAIDPHKVNVEIIDCGEYFDPRETPDPDIAKDVADREVGGLGLYLVRKIAVDIAYARRDGRNVTTFALARSTI
jgi:anti-sigma regulatory factor (Ser/Thr protein kinase)